MTRSSANTKLVLARVMSENKYHAQPTVVDGHSFASIKEAAQYGYLRLLEKAGRISQLELHPRYELIVKGVKVSTYIADFRYMEGGHMVVEDVKSGPTKTPVYRLKAKLMLACHGIVIRET